jgi:glycosyltransferase involved in cell wall biosynthesis
VVSFFDPDSLVQRLQLGHIANSVDEMREAIRSLLEDEADRHLTGRRAREFATREYTTGVASRYLELLDRQSPQVRMRTAQSVNQGADLP